MKSPSQGQGYQKELGSIFAKMGKALAGGHVPTIAKAIFAIDDSREQLLLKVLDMVNSECCTLCKRNADLPSMFRKISVEEIPLFKWKEGIDELQAKAPTLFQILSTITSHNDHRNTKRKGDWRHSGICMAVGCLLKERNQEMCGIQSVLSLMLFSEHIPKQVAIYIFYACMYVQM